MAVPGIDIGSQSTKVVILDGGHILSAVTLKTRSRAKKRLARPLTRPLPCTPDVERPEERGVDRWLRLLGVGQQLLLNSASTCCEAIK